MNRDGYLAEAIRLAQSSPLLTPGQKSLYVERLKTVSEAEQQEVTRFLKTRHYLLERKLRKILKRAAIKRTTSSFNQRMEER